MCFVCPVSNALLCARCPQHRIRRGAQKPIFRGSRSCIASLVAAVEVHQTRQSAKPTAQSPATKHHSPLLEFDLDDDTSTRCRLSRGILDSSRKPINNSALLSSGSDLDGGDAGRTSVAMTRRGGTTCTRSSRAVGPTVRTCASLGPILDWGDAGPTGGMRKKQKKSKKKSKNKLEH